MQRTTDKGPGRLARKQGRIDDEQGMEQEDESQSLRRALHAFQLLIRNDPILHESARHADQKLGFDKGNKCQKQHSDQLHQGWFQFKKKIVAREQRKPSHPDNQQRVHDHHFVESFFFDIDIKGLQNSHADAEQQGVSSGFVLRVMLR